MIAQLESEQETEGARIETLERQINDERAVAQADATDATDAAARKSGLSATADQLIAQLATLKDESRGRP